MKEILVGTAGYDYDDWQGAFYDPDLPHTWRFAYYCNQFRALLLPLGPSQSFIAGSLDELLDDSDSDFRLILELPVEGLNVARTIEALTALGPRLAGIVFSQISEVQLAARSAQVVSFLKSFSAHWPICVDASTSDSLAGEAVEALSRELCVSRVWRPDHDVDMIGGGDLLVARLGAVTLPRIREILERLALNRTEDCQVALFFDHTETAIEQARQCRVIAELMGV